MEADVSNQAKKWETIILKLVTLCLLVCLRGVAMFLGLDIDGREGTYTSSCLKSSFTQTKSISFMIPFRGLKSAIQFRIQLCFFFIFFLFFQNSTNPSFGLFLFFGEALIA